MAAQFPNAVARDSDLLVAGNLAQTTLAQAMATNDTVAYLTSGTGFPNNSVFTVDGEICLITSGGGTNTPTIQRGYDGTAAAPHSLGASVSDYFVAHHHNQLVSEVEAIETALGANMANISLTHNAAAYNFAAQTPGISLIAGQSNTLTLSPVPPGVNGSDSNHYLYLSGGTGTAEAVLITGGAAVAGASSGTLTFTPANSHSGAWTIASATGGLQEAVQAIGAGNAGEIRVLSPVNLYAPVTSLTSGVVAFSGIGKDSFVVNRGTGFTSGNMFSNPNANTQWVFRDIGINQGTGATTGTAISLTGASGTNHIYETKVQNGNVGVSISGPAYTRLHGLTVGMYDQTFKALACISIGGNSINTFISDSILGGYPDTANIVQYALLVLYADGVWVSNTGFSADVPIGITASGGQQTANVKVEGWIDGFRSQAITVGGAGNLANIRFQIRIDGQAGNGWTATGPAVGIIYGGTATLENFELLGGCICGCSGVGLYIGVSNGTGRSIRITGVTLSDNNRGNHANYPAIEIAAGAAGITLVGCDVHNEAAGHQKYSLQLDGNLSDSLICGNRLGTVAVGECETAPLNIAGGAVLTRVTFGPNEGDGTLILPSLPTSSAGLASGQIWVDTSNSNVLKKV